MKALRAIVKDDENISLDFNADTVRFEFVDLEQGSVQVCLVWMVFETRQQVLLGTAIIDTDEGESEPLVNEWIRSVGKLFQKQCQALDVVVRPLAVQAWLERSELGLCLVGGELIHEWDGITYQVEGRQIQSS